MSEFLVCQLDQTTFVVISLTSTSGKPRQYHVKFNGYRFLCNCPHFLKNGINDPYFVCKHIIAVSKVIGNHTTLVKTRILQPRNQELQKQYC